MPLESFRVTRSQSRSPVEFLTLVDSPHNSPCPTPDKDSVSCPVCSKPLPTSNTSRIKHLRGHKRGTYRASLVSEWGAEMCDSCGKPYTLLALHHSAQPRCAPSPKSLASPTSTTDIPAPSATFVSTLAIPEPLAPLTPGAEAVRARAAGVGGPFNDDVPTPSPVTHTFSGPFAF